MSIYKNNFDKIKEEYIDIFSAMERASEYFHIHFCLIGAQSRDVWTRHLDENKRLTRDVDYTVQLDNYHSWEKLRDYLINSEKMLNSPKEPYRFTLQNKVVDILPFGGISKGTDLVFHHPQMVISIAGLEEVTSMASIEFDNFSVVSVPGLCTLKLIAFSEKPFERKKDLEDFIYLLYNYKAIKAESTFDEPDFNYLMDTKKDFELVVAYVLGREIKRIISANQGLINSITLALQSALDGYTIEEVSFLAGNRDTAGNRDVSRYIRLIEVFKALND